VSAIARNLPPGERWYAVHTRPLAESRAGSHLEQQGFHTFYPRYRKTVRHARKVNTVLAPLFPRYLFVRFNQSEDQWRCVNSTWGVVRLVGHGDMPEPILHGVIETLVARMGPDDAMDWTRSLSVGQVVRIVEGPFADFVGTLEKLSGAGRVAMLLRLFGRSVSVTLRSNALAPPA
jgi:transcription elongation factor/antiterminator RfaH